jgi:monoamine oxidase
LLDAVSTFANGVELDRLSAEDFRRYHDLGVNWRVTEGYGALVNANAAGLDVRLGCAATRIDHSGPRLRVETVAGPIEARAVIVTTPTPAIADETLRFHPPLADKVAAAQALPLGLADKLFLRVDQPEALPAETRFMGAVDRTATASYHLRPFGRPIIEGYFGGDLARHLEAEGEQAFAQFAIEEFAASFGSDIRRRLHLLAVSAWDRDPFARGSYSYARVGHAAARAALAAPVDDRIFFAGEACSSYDFSTAHGAYRTGVQAAQAVAVVLV